MDVDAEMPEYRALASYYADQGGALWVAEADGQLVGMIATRPLAEVSARLQVRQPGLRLLDARWEEEYEEPLCEWCPPFRLEA